MTTPLGWLASRLTVGRRTLRIASLSSLVVAILIVVGGGIVRVTGSGLGCPDWPECTDGSLGPTSAMGWHAAVEFANRLLTGLLCVAVAAVILAARFQAEPAPTVTRWAWAQFWIVVLNAVVGGVTVLARLSPYMVAAHFLAAMLLLTAATVSWDRARRLPNKERVPVSLHVRRLGSALLLATGALVILGTAVTGAGPHAGDNSHVARMPFPWIAAALVHAGVAALAFAMGIALWRAATRVRSATVVLTLRAYFAVFLAQGLVGIVQSLIGLPEALVAVHLMGASLVWVGAVRVALATRAVG
ncbi:cytochrome oxidase assembly protein [Frondihabitans sp. PAMC 28766]|uniref:COX15/CtaA family protein n=1 Tax=Frondihabitans sp. PAMC 28766 TaxID=1795630 RepID=UPI00078BB657|nr:COX15/CtaA family protein [Frondihabitans sp. PAMC 28766]AMM19013.1 cytochrome oxidase assembly protein [Frondihabitans sp. PAMC 28766]